MEELQGVHYDAFISYRHSELDSFVAENLHKKLEAFKLPGSAKSKAKSGKTKISRIFRDVDELPLSDNLSDPINNALANSDFLITICTPRYPQSRWCLKEIETFLQLHDREHILVVLAEDEPAASFPEILTYEQVEIKDENGNIRFEKKQIEPLAADTRGENKKEILKAMDTAVLKLCAAIFGMNYDDLRQRHREQKIKKMATVFGSVGAAVLLFAIFATVMLIRISRQNALISEQYAELNDKYAGAMAQVADTLLGCGRRKDAAYVVRDVLPDKEEGYNAGALKRLYESLNIYSVGDAYYPACSYDVPEMPWEYKVSFDNKYVLINEGTEAYVFDRDGAQVNALPGDPEDAGSIFEADFCGSSGVITVLDGEAEYRRVLGDEVKSVDTSTSISFISPSEDGLITLLYGEDVLYGVNESGEIAYEINVSEVFEESYLDMMSADFEGGRFIAVFMDYSGRIDILMAEEASGKVIVSFTKESPMDICAILDGDNIIFAMPGMGNFNDSTRIYSIDTLTGETLWIRDVPSFLAVDICVSDNMVFVYDRYIMLVLDKKQGGVKNYYNSDKAIIEFWPDFDENCVYYVTQEGKVYFCNDTYSCEWSENFFSKIPSEFLYDAKFINGDLYYWFDRANYITRYSLEETAAVKVENSAYERTILYEKDAIPALEEADDISPALKNADTAFYSDDEKYIVAQYSNKTTKIIDSESFEVLKSLPVSDSLLSSLKYYEGSGNYILTASVYSYILDKDFNVISRTYSVVGKEGDCLILCAPDETFYKVPVVGYKELISMADEYLKDYTPADDVRDKYEIR